MTREGYELANRITDKINDRIERYEECEQKIGELHETLRRIVDNGMKVRAYIEFLRRVQAEI